MTQDVLVNETRAERLGVVLLDSDHFHDDLGLFDPEDGFGLGSLPIGFFENPATWPVPTAFAVAHGATSEAVLTGADVALRGFQDAVARLSPVAAVVVADCGFFWRAAGSTSVPEGTDVVYSGLEQLEDALAESDAPLGVVTYSEEHLWPLLAAHPMEERLRVIGLSNQPNWAGLRPDDFVAVGGWTQDGLRRELAELVDAERTRGRLQDVESVVLECTNTVQFREDIDRIVGCPVFDARSRALDLLQASEQTGSGDMSRRSFLRDT